MGGVDVEIGPLAIHAEHQIRDSIQDGTAARFAVLESQHSGFAGGNVAHDA